MHYHFGYPFNPPRADLPTAPQNLRVTASDDTSITLEWDASTQGDFPISNYKLIADNLVIATPVGTSFIYDAVPPNELVSYRVQAVDSDGNAGPWSDTLTYTNVVATDDAPIYLMTEPLVNDGSFDYLFNSASSGTKWDAKLLTSTDTAWNPDSAQYPEDGTIDLSGGNKADTQWEAPQDTEWTMSGIYNVEMGVSYDMYSIHYKGNQTCDIYLGSSTEDLTLSEEDKPYTPPTGNWIIEEEPPAIIFADGYTPVYISMNDFASPPVSAMPSGVTISPIDPLIGTVQSVVNINGGASDITLQVTDAPHGVSAGLVTGDDSGIMPDYQLEQSMQVFFTGDPSATIGIYLPAGTYDISFVGSRDIVSVDRKGDYTFGSYRTMQLDASENTTLNSGWTNIVSTGETFNLLCEITAGSAYGYLNGIDFMQIEPVVFSDEWYLSVGGTPSTPMPAGITITNQELTDDTWRTLVNKDNVDTGIEFKLTGTQPATSTSGEIEGSNNGVLYDYQLEQYIWVDGTTFTYSLRFARAGTYVVRDTYTTTSTNVTHLDVGFHVSVGVGSATWIESDRQSFDGRIGTGYAEWKVIVAEDNTEIVLTQGYQSDKSSTAGLFIKEQS